MLILIQESQKLNQQEQFTQNVWFHLVDKNWKNMNRPIPIQQTDHSLQIQSWNAKSHIPSQCICMGATDTRLGAVFPPPLLHSFNRDQGALGHVLMLVYQLICYTYTYTVCRDILYAWVNFLCHSSEVLNDCRS